MNGPVLTLLIWIAALTLLLFGQIDGGQTAIIIIIGFFIGALVSTVAKGRKT